MSSSQEEEDAEGTQALEHLSWVDGLPVNASHTDTGDEVEGKNWRAVHEHDGPSRHGQEGASLAACYRTAMAAACEEAAACGEAAARSGGRYVGARPLFGG